MKNYLHISKFFCTFVAKIYTSVERLINIQKPVTVCRASAGTGKTYTLAAYYVGLLLSGEDYRSILAITFTNKATAEMSERIISYLYAISRGEQKDFLARARCFMLRDQHVPDAVLAARAEECFRKMLLDYDNVQVMTIDSFLQTLLSGLAGILKMSAGLSTELDIDHVIRTAVDQLLTTELTEDDKQILEDYMRLKLDKESQWDVRQSLCQMAKELYNESVQILDADGRICFDASTIARRRTIIEDLWRTNAEVRELQQLVSGIRTEELIDNKATMPKPLPHAKDIEKACARLRRSVEAPEEVPSKDRFRGLTDLQMTDAQGGKWTKLPVAVVDAAVRATLLAQRVEWTYNTLQLTIRFSRDMELMASLQALIQRNLSEANCALLARTAGTLSKALRNGDADFILEKAGIRYRHVLMDEFQDTSRLQWSVIKQLLQDVLAGTGNTLLIVGDIKQSIYRWRNGDWHIMDALTAPDNELTHDKINERFTSLTRNFRSSEEVVRFNLSLFQYLIGHQGAAERIYGEQFTPEHLEEFYQAKKKGGYVHFQAFPKGTKEELTAAMFDTMEELLQKGAIPSDIMVLVREKKEAALITDLHAYLDPDSYPHLSRVAIVSADSFLLEASEAVKIIIAGLRVWANADDVAAKYIEIATGRTGFIEEMHTRIPAHTPLYEAVCTLIAILLCDEDGQYTGTETAYLNNLLDRTRGYVSAYGSSVTDFLNYWDDTMHEKSVPASSANAIRIMTVHASKGLQAQTLFVPFCSWTKEAGKHAQKIWCEVPKALEAGNDYVPIADGAEMANSAYRAEYDEEHENMRVDNLNMLYVALTRAEDNLYISTSYPVLKDGKPGTFNHVGKYIMDFVGGDEYEAGEPVIKGQRDKAEVTKEEAEFWANSDQVRFVQSQEGALYTDYGEEAYRRMARMDEGTLCHEIFANIRKADELEAVLDDFESRGEIRDRAQKETLKTLISSAWNGNEQMRDWFTAPWQLKLEQAIYIDRRELRPDRVMINPVTNEAIVLDYKFGHWENQYRRQVREYMEALRRMGYVNVKGFLWYARKNQLVEVK